jgi:protein gp37
MGKDSKISWTNHTFSMWWGCDEVAEDPACTHCYAREFSKRLGRDLWGDKKPRQMNSEHYWNDPLRWDRAAAKAGVKAMVFCSSMSDIFEDRRDLDAPRERLWKLIEQTPNLIWLLLTKRHDCIKRMIPASWMQNPRPNVWMGITAANQKWADERIPELLSIPAVCHWVSAEPLVGPLDLRRWLGPDRLSWAVVGGESGHGARRMDPEWARDIRKQCQDYGAAFHFKQKGRILSAEMGCKDKEGKKLEEWPEEFRVQDFPKPVMV